MTRFIDQLRISYRRFTLKHEVRKEYLTILLPVLIALLIILSALWISGPFEPTEQKKSKSYLEKVREEYMRSIGKVVKKEKAETGRMKGEMASWVRKYLDHIIIWAVIIAILPYSIDSFIERRKKRKYEDEYGDFLFEIAELLRSGIDPMKTLIEISKSETRRGDLRLPKAELKALAPLIKDAASKLSIGYSFEDVMMRIAKETKSKLVEKYAKLVVTATYIGGEVSDIILRSSQDIKNYLRIQREKESNLRQYMYIFYIAQAVLIGMLFLINDKLLPYITGIEIGSADILFGKKIVLGGGLEGIPLEKYFFHLIMINALIIGLVIGKIMYGALKHGLLHSSILMIASYVVCVMIFPLPGVANVQIDVVSGDNQYGMPLEELPEPLVFKVTRDGKPYDGYVKIVVEGPGGAKGRAEPNYVKPDEEGIVRTKITLGKEPGLYVIRIKAGSSEGVASAYARSYKP